MKLPDIFLAIKKSAETKEIIKSAELYRKRKNCALLQNPGGGKRCGHFADCDHDSCPETDGMWKDQCGLRNCVE